MRQKLVMHSSSRGSSLARWVMISLMILLTSADRVSATTTCGAWQIVSSPSPGGASRLLGVAAETPTDVWAVGYYSADYRTQLPLALHWDGQAWSTSPTASIDSPAAFNDVVEIAPDDVWAVGDQGWR